MTKSTRELQGHRRLYHTRHKEAHLKTYLVGNIFMLKETKESVEKDQLVVTQEAMPHEMRSQDTVGVPFGVLA